MHINIAYLPASWPFCGFAIPFFLSIGFCPSLSLSVLLPPSCWHCTLTLSIKALVTFGHLFVCNPTCLPISLSLALSVSFTLSDSVCLQGTPFRVTVTSAATGGIKSASRVAGFVVYQRWQIFMRSFHFALAGFVLFFYPVEQGSGVA